MDGASVTQESTLKQGLLDNPATYIKDKYSTFTNTSVHYVLSFLRWTNLFTALIVLGIALFSIISYVLTLDVRSILLTGYCILFSALLFLFELHTKKINRKLRINYGFMFTYIGRSIFIFFLATLLFAITSPIKKLIGIGVFCVSIINVFVIVVHPAFRRKEITLFDDPSVTYSSGESELKNIMVNNPNIAQKVITQAAKMSAA